MQNFRWFLLPVLAVLLQAPVNAELDEDYETKQWTEVETQLPAPPKEAGLQSFYVSAATNNKFFIDLPSLTIGADGVVRYSLVVLTQGGARNVSFEGIRCEAREHRIYATGRRDGTWSKSRNNEWERIQDEYANRVHAALFLDYFCPGGVIVPSADEAKNALKLGGHPANKQW